MRFPTLLLVFLVLSAPVARGHDAVVPATIAQHALIQLNPRIVVVHGSQRLPDVETRGFMINPGAILTRNGIIIVDPGSSAEIGRELLVKLRAISDKPVIAVFNTHVHGDHWLGNAGIRAAYPQVPIYAHRRMIERVAAGAGEGWHGRFMTMTKGAVEGTRVTRPTVGLDGGETLVLDDVTLRIHHSGPAHTDHDLAIEVVDAKTLFLGDLVAARRVPNSDVPSDANFKGSIHAIEVLLQRPVTLYVPGHGPSGGRAVPEASLRFLKALSASVQRHYDHGLQSYEMKHLVIADLDAYRDWNNFEEMGRVIDAVFREVEADSF